MPVNGNNDKQLRYKLINVVRLVFLIPLSFTFDNRQENNCCHLPLQIPEISLAVCSVIFVLSVPVVCHLFTMYLLFFFLHRESNRACFKWSAPTRICFHSVNITGQYFQPSHRPLSFCFMIVEHRIKCASTQFLYMWTFIRSAPKQ